MAQDDFSVSRSFAAEILNVSLRTLDRYNKTEKISSVRRGRELFFSEKELLDFKAKAMAAEEYEKVQKARQNPSQPTKSQKSAPQQARSDFHEVHEAQVLEQSPYDDDLDKGFAEIRDTMLRRSPDEEIYKDLYDKTETELRETRQRLETAHYRIGQLESELKTMVPQLEYKKQHQELLQLASENRQQQDNILGLERQIAIEQFAKRVYAGFLITMVALMPLLLILRLVA